MRTAEKKVFHAFLGGSLAAIGATLISNGLAALGAPLLFMALLSAIDYAQESK